MTGLRLITLSELVAAALERDASELGTHWRERARVAAPRMAGPVPADQAAQVARIEEGAIDDVRALAGCLGNDAQWPGEVIRSGWAFGDATYRAGLSLQHLVKEADLLLAILLAAVERSTSVGDTEIDVFSAREGISLVRRLHGAGSLFTEAACTAFAGAVRESLRQRLRALRHDLRNPIGTIRGAVALMQDELVPIETRQGVELRAMLARNAESLDALVAAQLGEGGRFSTVFTTREVSLHDIGLAVRRSLRAALSVVGCDIVVSDRLPTASVDGPGFELALSTLVLAAMQVAEPGEVIAIEPDASRDDRRVTLAVIVRAVDPGDALADQAIDDTMDGTRVFGGRPASRASARVAGERNPAWPTAMRNDDWMRFARELCESMGARVHIGDTLRLEWATRASDTAADDASNQGAASGGGRAEWRRAHSQGGSTPSSHPSSRSTDMTSAGDVGDVPADAPVSSSGGHASDELARAD